MKKNLHKIIRIIFSLVVIGLGIFFEINKIGENFLESWHLGSWLIFVGVLMIVVQILDSLKKTKKIVDERIQYIGMKASRITFLALVLASFVIMIVDGINPIQIPYRLFMAHLVSLIVLVYFIAYKIIEKRN